MYHIQLDIAHGRIAQSDVYNTKHVHIQDIKSFDNFPSEI